jgi:hypothetical protein
MNPTPFLKKLTPHAQWIWDENNTQAHDFMIFRASVSLDKPPEKAEAVIAAETKYWLYINGEMAVFEGGLFRESVPGAGWADRVDLACYLKEGANEIEALVWYYGNGGRNNTRLPQAGFLFDCAALNLQSGPKFTCQRHPAYYKTGEPHPAYLFGGDNIGYDANKSLDDSAFAPTKIYDAKLFGDLYERPIPLLRIEKEQYFTETQRLKLPHACAFVPIVECNAQGGEVLDLRTDRYVVNGGPGDQDRKSVV